MTTEQILNLECKTEEEKRIIQKELKKIKPFKKYSEEENVKINDLEKLIFVLSKRYMMRIREITFHFMVNENAWVWRSVLISDKTLHTLNVCYGTNVYDILSKSALMMYSEVERGIEKRK